MGLIQALLIVGAITFANSGPVLDQSGFTKLVVAINENIDEKEGSNLIQSIKDLFIETSEMMYYASMTRFYVKEVTILTPKHWNRTVVPEIENEARHGETYETAAVQITKRDLEHGDPPYTRQTGGCGEEGHPVIISDQYLLDLMNNYDEMIVKYGPIGKVLTQEFTKYRYGYFEEYGYPSSGNDDERHPSTYTQAFYNLETGKWGMTVVNNTCADTKLEGRFLHIEGEEENSQIVEGCDIDEETGEIVSDSCFFAADKANKAMSSMGSYQYTDLVSVFCDDEYWPHNHDTRNGQNEKCLDEKRDWEPMSTWTTILKHPDFENGHNGGGVPDTLVPKFTVYSGTNANFVLVLDNSRSMNDCYRLENLKTTVKKWIDKVAEHTKVALVKFGQGYACASGDKTITKGCYVTINTDKDRTDLMTAVDQMALWPQYGTTTALALEQAYKIMKDDHDVHQGSPGVVLLVTDGMATDDISNQALWMKFHMQHIRIITMNIGHEIDQRSMDLVSHTGGRAFVSKDCSGAGSQDAFQYASDTFIPSSVGDKYMQRQTTSTETVVGSQMFGRCMLNNDGKECYQHAFNIDKSLNKEVNINMRITKMGQEVDAKDFIEDVSVRRRLDNETIMTIENPEIDGFSLSWDSVAKNIANFEHKSAVPVEYTENILDVYLTPKFTTQQDFLFTSVEFVTSAKRSFDGDDGEDYYISCQHPVSMERDKQFKIEALVKRGETPIDHANVVAKIYVSRESDPNNQYPPLFIKLSDEGDETVSGDANANDGIYTTQLTPDSFQIDVNGALGMSIICNMVESDDAIWNDNNFLGKKKSLPTQNGEFTPYCCGTKEQKWNIPRNDGVTKLIRSSHESGAFLDPSLFVKDSDFGPPARIVDLKAEKFGDDTDGLVKLSWTATGDDWGTGTAHSYNLVYSDKRKGLMSSNKIVKDSRMLVGGSMDPVPAGQKMEVIVKLENHHIPGTYLFALNASDDAGKVSMPSNVARVNFHDGSPLVFDVDPHLVHGHKKNDMPFEDKIRAIVKDERVVTGFMALIEKNKKIVWDAENNVMEKRLKEKMGTNSHLVEKIMEKIKKDEVLRAVYKSKLL